MLYLWLSQFLTYLVIASPPGSGDGLRLGLLLFGLWVFWKKPWLCLLACFWQAYNLNVDVYWLQGIPRWDSHLRCDERFWFVCSSEAPRSFLLQWLSSTRLGTGAEMLRNWVEQRCLAWHPIWGRFALSLILGGKAEEHLTPLYQGLGFLHVLVISGSQFSLLSRWLKQFCRAPFVFFYALALIDWRIFRPLLLMSDILTIFGLTLYLVACGASPPCQRAYLEQIFQFQNRWFLKPDGRRHGASWIFSIQACLFPDTWFSLSNLLSWGAVLSLKHFHQSRNFFAQLKTSLSIQLLGLAVFGRMSLSSLFLDFFVSPLWDLLLAVCLAGILIPELQVQASLSLALDFFHQILWTIDLQQSLVFGSSALTLRPFALWWGRLAAAAIFAFIGLKQSAGLSLKTRLR